MTCGIYLLKFEGTDKVYVGQSINIEQRYAIHKQRFKSANTSKKLVEAYSLYGEPSLEILCECDEKDLNVNENEAIEIFNAVIYGFNTNAEADTCPIFYGEEHGRSVYSNDKIEEVFEILVSRFDLKHAEISALTGVPISRISSISRGDTHSWLKLKHPEKWGVLQNRPKYHNSGGDRGKVFPPIRSPEGQDYTITNITHFAQEHGLGQSNLSAVLSGKRKQHKGWKLAKES
jgi:hypothetical protein